MGDPVAKFKISHSNGRRTDVPTIKELNPGNNVRKSKWRIKLKKKTSKDKNNKTIK